MADSQLVDYEKYSPNISSPRNHEIDTISIHTMAGNLTVETCGNIFANPNYECSSQYGIGSDGRIGQYVSEGDRSWCTSSRSNDNRAITIEVASYESDTYACTDAAMESLINLLVDICQRNGIDQLRWQADPDLIGEVDQQNMTVHRWFAQKACLPIKDTELLTKSGWVSLADIKIGDEIATAHIDDLSIVFGPVRDIVPIREQDVYSIRDLIATADHRIVHYNNHGKQHICFFNEIFDSTIGYLPNAGYYTGPGIDMTNDEIELMIAIQADGHYMYDNRIWVNGSRVKTDVKKYYGIEFHLKKERKIKRIIELLNSCEYKYNINRKSDGSVSIRSYDKGCMEFASNHLDDKKFMWDIIEMSPVQAKYFIDRLPFWDGSIENNSYYSVEKDNTDIVSAIASINGIGVLRQTKPIYGIFFKKSKRSLGDGEKKRIIKQPVSCVTVDSGFILIRQDKRTTIVGNCPGPYLFEKHGYIADEVNKRLGNPSYHPTNSNPESNADQFVKHFEMIGLNPAALCGLMGNIFAESGLIPNNLQNSFEDKLGMNDDAYTQAVDDGSYDNFVHDSAGYGLAQWTYYSRKEGLLNFAKGKGVSIGDLYMQMDYLWQELQNTIDIAKLNACSTVREASDIILHEFERPADQSEEVEIRRSGYGQEFYNKYYGEPDAPAEFEAYNVRVTATLLNVRSGPGTNFGINSSIMDQGLYGICDESDGQGASRWGKMSNGWGWISLDYTERE